MGHARVVGALPAVFEASSPESLRAQLEPNIARFSGVSSVRDAMLGPMADNIVTAVFSAVKAPGEAELFRQPYLSEHLRGRATTTDARLFRSALRNVLGMTEVLEAPTIRNRVVYDDQGVPRRDIVWNGLAEVHAPVGSAMVCEGIFMRPAVRHSGDRPVWVAHQLVGLVAPVSSRHIAKQPSRSVNLEFYDTTDTLPGDFGYWQSPMASFH